MRDAGATRPSMSDTTWTPAAVAGIAAGFALVSRRLAVTPVSGAMVFVGFGILLGPAALDLVSLRQDSAQLRTLVEAALTLVLTAPIVFPHRKQLRRRGGNASGRPAHPFLQKP